MIKITTDRLIVFPLNQIELENCMESFEYIEEKLNLNSSGIIISAKQRRVNEIRLEKMKQQSDKYMWSTVWPIILQSENRIIGIIMLKGYPEETGEVTIGYALEEAYRLKGYMTEVLVGIKEWIFENQDVNYIIADTLKNNLPSQKVLQKIGMTKYHEDEECFWWRLGR